MVSYSRPVGPDQKKVSETVQRIVGIVRDYAWGSRTALPELTGKPGTGEPQAEMWFGTHPAAPSLLAGAQSGTLADLIAAAPAQQLGTELARRTPELPFLLKLLAADRALSIQVHPTAAQAAEGFARENAAGIPLDAPQRNYKDPHHKPELLVALTPFTALAGFRPVERTAQLFAALGCADVLGQPVDLREVLQRWLTQPADVTAAAVHRVLRGAQDLLAAPPDCGWMLEVAQLAIDVSRDYPNDPGILCALLLNLVVLRPGEALYLDAGQLHAYVSGTGVEIMANSDNVLRGGLTAKHIDVPELLRIVQYDPVDDPRIAAAGDGVFHVPAEEFCLRQVTSGQQRVAGPAMVLSVAPGVLVAGEPLAAGDAVWISAGEVVDVLSDAHASANHGVFIASPGVIGRP